LKNNKITQQEVYAHERGSHNYSTSSVSCNSFSMLWLYCDCSTRVTHRGESSADEKRPVRSCATRCRDKHLRWLHRCTCTSNCTSSSGCRAPATPLPPVSPAPITTPVFHLHRLGLFFTRNDLHCVEWGVKLYSLSFIRTATALSGSNTCDRLSNDETEKDIKEWLKFVAERNMEQVQLGRHRRELTPQLGCLTTSCYMYTEGRVLSDLT